MIRTRFAPSPTGEIHIGGLRTFLYSFAFAKANQGKIVLRLEDTDRARYVGGASERLIQTARLFGLSWDEGPDIGGEFGPYVQSERLDIYKKYADELVKNGHAYHCFCTPERLSNLREEQQKNKLPPKYDGYCKTLSKQQIQENLKNNVPYVIRLNVPQNKEIIFRDEVLGEIKINSSDIDDQVLIKSDGFPTYHLAVVIDDHLMQISHIIRGNDWLPSTPKHILLYQAFGWEIPKYVHLPNLKEKGASSKLSKRRGAFYAYQFLEEGYLPEAVMNFIMLLGWNPGTTQEIFSLDEFCKTFSIERIQTSDLVVFDREKLLWMNGYYIRSYSLEVIFQKYCDWNNAFNKNSKLCLASKDVALKVLGLVYERAKTFVEINDLTSYFFEFPTNYSKEELVSNTSDSNRCIDILNSLIDSLENQTDLNPSVIEENLRKVVQIKSFTPKETFMVLRYALTARPHTPPVFDIISVLGFDESIKRIKYTLELAK
mgnify:CR=1 FL=1